MKPQLSSEVFTNPTALLASSASKRFTQNEKISLMKNLKTTAGVILSSVGGIVDG